MLDLLYESKELLKPFSSYYNSMDIGDAFYFPQRFLMPVTIGFMVFGAFCFVLLSLVLVLIAGLNTMKVNIHKTSYAFINSATSNAMQFRQGFTDNDMKPVESVINEINGYFDQLLLALLVGLIIAVTFSCLFFLMTVLKSLSIYKHDVLEIRKGIWTVPVPRETFAIKDSIAYSGIVISNFLIGFVIVLVTLGLVFIALSMKILWEFILENWYMILIIVLPAIGQVIAIKVIEFVSVTPEYLTQRQYFLKIIIKNNRIYSILDIVFSYFGIAGGIISAVVRYAIAIVVLAFGITRVDKPLLPEWILKFLWLDSANSTYYSTILLHHNHNHPIYLTMVRLICIFFYYQNTKKRQRRSIKRKRRRYRN